MLFETEFDIGDEVFYITSSIVKDEIIGIKIVQTESGTRVEYMSNNQNCLKPEAIYKTKEEAGASWLKRQGLDIGLKET